MRALIVIGAVGSAFLICGCEVSLKAPALKATAGMAGEERGEVRTPPARPEAGSAALEPGEVLAKVGDRVITEGMLEERIGMMPPRAVGRFNTPAGKKSILNKMVELELIAVEGERLGLGDDKDVRVQVEEFRKRAIAEKLHKKIISEVKVGEAEVKAEYEAQGDRYKTPRQVKVSQIVFTWDKNAAPEDIAAVEKDAQGILERAKKGEDFAELAKKYSLDQTSAPKGGDIGSASRRQLPPEAYDAAMALQKTGDLTGLVKGKEDIRILKATEVMPEKARPFEEVRSWMERMVQNKKQNEAWQKYLDDAKERVRVEIYEDKLGATEKTGVPRLMPQAGKKPVEPEQGQVAPAAPPPAQ
jgi:hypothetical protein